MRIRVSPGQTGLRRPYPIAVPDPSTRIALSPGPVRSVGILLSGVLVAFLLGCPFKSDDGNDDGLNCTFEARAGINLQVRDATTGAPAACGATGEIREGDLVELVTLSETRCATFPDSLSFAGAWERAGTYTVVVKKPGYQDWVKEEVVVMEGACHVQTVTLQANLEPEP